MAMIDIFQYIPQAYINFKRKLTIGWSVGNVILDFSGGALSVFQMVIDGINTGKCSTTVTFLKFNTFVTRVS